MKSIRDILLTQYIGAIAVGFILAQAVIRFVNEITQAVAGYWALSQARSSALSVPSSFPWTNFIISMVAVALDLIVAFLLIRWLYGGQRGKGDVEESTEEGQP